MKRICSKFAKLKDPNESENERYKSYRLVLDVQLFLETRGNKLFSLRNFFLRKHTMVYVR